MTTRQLLRLYPAAWRQRYEEEFLELTGDAPLTLQQAIDIVSGAIDARLRRGVASPVNAGDQNGGLMLRVLKSECRSGGLRMSRRDGLVGAALLLAVSVVFAAAGAWLRRAGYPDAAEAVLAMSFPMAMTATMPWTFMKGQPWRAQLAVVGGTMLILAAIGAVTLLF